MSWNCRVMKRTMPEFGWYHAVHEAYYDDYGTPVMWTVEAVDIGGDGISGCRQYYDMVGKAFNLPVLDYETGIDNDFKYMWE